MVESNKTAQNSGEKPSPAFFPSQTLAVNITEDLAFTSLLLGGEGAPATPPAAGADRLDGQRVSVASGRVYEIEREVGKAVGLTPEQLRADLMERYKKLLSVNEITVTVISVSASVYVSGAVLRPGRIPMDRPLTALEAIMEAGGFDSRRARIADVSVIRNENGKQQHFSVNLKRALTGQDPEPFYLKPFDIIHVPEKTFNF